MKITEYSKNRLLRTLAGWEVVRDYSEPMYNYLVHGFYPGSFFTAVLANDFVRAVQHSHPANTMQALKALVGWIDEYMPKEARGDYKKVERWCEANEDARRSILESAGLIYTEQQEIMKTLKGEQTFEPYLP